jgi:hypothetical protein
MYSYISSEVFSTAVVMNCGVLCSQKKAYNDYSKQTKITAKFHNLTCMGLDRCQIIEYSG